MSKELVEFEVGTLEWALAKALQGHLVTCNFLWESSGEGYIEWDGETTFMVYTNYSNDTYYLSWFDNIVNTEFNKDDWRVYDYKIS